MHCSAVLNRTKDIINQICLSNSDSIDLLKSINPSRVPATIHAYGFYAKQITCHRVCTLDRVKPLVTYSDRSQNDDNDHCATTRKIRSESDDYKVKTNDGHSAYAPITRNRVFAIS